MYTEWEWEGNYDNTRDDKRAARWHQARHNNKHVAMDTHSSGPSGRQPENCHIKYLMTEGLEMEYLMAQETRKCLSAILFLFRRIFFLTHTFLGTSIH